jgi:hypothetical protein
LKFWQSKDFCFVSGHTRHYRCLDKRNISEHGIGWIPASKDVTEAESVNASRKFHGSSSWKKSFYHAAGPACIPEIFQRPLYWTGFHLLK